MCHRQATSSGSVSVRKQDMSRTPASGCAEPSRLSREDEPDGLLPDDDTAQELSVRGGCCRQQSERAADGSGEKSRLAEETGQAQRDNIAGRVGGRARQDTRAHRLNVSFPLLTHLDCNGARTSNVVSELSSLVFGHAYARSAHQCDRADGKGLITTIPHTTRRHP